MKVYKKVSLSVLSLLAAFSITSSVSAATSNATITFTPGAGAPEVLDPENPENPYEPTDPTDTGTGETGPLTLDYVSSINFGENEIKTTAQKYQSSTLRPFIQVTDRRGTGEGWNVTAQMSNFTVDEQVTLPGSLLTLSNGSVISTSKSDAPVPNNPVELNPGGTEVKIVTADQNAGLGSWITRWLAGNTESNENVTLEVPAGMATQGNHTAVITWTLTAGPGQ
ncbi:WxL domain-containing protein [Bhargavaea ginsengi]|uniref:WxL domain-containing protein n=1 Tax=Bhargavaea ginsengi TaxID=426757 RepID=UPI00203B2BFF|nr:WxL domain-containing protein [Bhargavaea ginsengi]MCM3087528.1 WxL domain-containing protein [Bhargavaea ginsengi]